MTFEKGLITGAGGRLGRNTAAELSGRCHIADEARDALGFEPAHDRRALLTAAPTE
jgi:hypothetical protein